MVPFIVAKQYLAQTTSRLDIGSPAKKKRQDGLVSPASCHAEWYPVPEILRFQIGLSPIAVEESSYGVFDCKM